MSSSNAKVISHPTLDRMYSEAKELLLPHVCKQTINQGDAPKTETYKKILDRYGIVRIKLQYDDPDATTLKDIVGKIGEFHQHDNEQRVMWDIRVGGSSGKEALARSHSTDEFVMHTDCSYEHHMPDYFGLYVVHSDHYGGGQLLFIDGSLIFHHLSAKSLAVLQETKFRIKVPAEFKKHIEYIEEPLIDENLNLRYRREIILEQYCSLAQKQALDELERVINSPHLIRRTVLEEGEIILVDNRRFLHARTRIKDKQRHLKRIRFFDRVA